VPASGNASFARSFDPCTSILTMLCGESFGGGAVESVSRLGKLVKARGTNTGTGLNGRSAARRVSPLSQGRGVMRREKEGGRGLRPCEDRRAWVWLPARRSAVAEVGRRRLASNKLGTALQKERSGSSERGSSSERASADETVVGCVGRRDESRVGLTGEKTGEDRHRPRVARERHQRSLHRQKRCSGRGTGAVMATGSYEGFPTDGRHPGSSRGVGFHETASTVVLAVSASSDPHGEIKSRACGEMAAPGKLGEA